MTGAKKIDIKQFKHESLSEKIKQHLSSREKFDQVHVIFGGTGAVGGQAVIELIELYDYLIKLKGPGMHHQPRIIATGYALKEIEDYIQKIKAIFEKRRRSGHGFRRIQNDTTSAVYAFERPSGLRLEFYQFDASPKLSVNLDDVVSKTASTEENVKSLKDAIENLERPFANFLKQHILIGDMAGKRVRSVISGIPIPSVAAYRMADVDKALRAIDAKNRDNERLIKREVLQKMAGDFGQIKESYAEEVLIAHTTSVGGMYVIENGEQKIKLGFAHSSMGDLLLEKQFYANVLTEAYSQLGIKSLITAAAIGIDSIRYNQTLPMSGEVFKKFESRKRENTLPFDNDLIDRKSGRRFNYHFDDLRAYSPAHEDDSKPRPLRFLDGKEAKDLEVRYAIRSGENGWFSLDNTWALYLNMKVATQEELAHVLVFNAIFGDDQQRPFFDQNGINYYTQTDNSSLAFALLGNSEPFRRYQTSGFSPKAYQDLGSNKHQGELHTIGLYMLMHRIMQLNPREISRISSKYTLSETREYVDRNTPALLLEDVVDMNAERTALDFCSMLNLQHDIGLLSRLIGYRGDWTPFVQDFFTNLLEAVKKTYQTITSLGTPIIYRDSNGKDRMIFGPYLAPIDIIATHSSSIREAIVRRAEEHGVDATLLFEWYATNNGFVDLRPEATIVTARSIDEISEKTVRKVSTETEFRDAILDLAAGQYFATSGTLAFIGRMQGLYEQMQSYDVRFGTYNKWKSLFPIDENNNHPIIPGIVEAMRLYSEGLGKVTGTELLYPQHGYFVELD
ncbi:MAG: hypothetical protein AAF570_00210 [Bacteroidota bacterium]